MPSNDSQRNDMSNSPIKYLALHLRFEVDMVAYSHCQFGGGESEGKELQAYRETHFPLLLQRLKNLRCDGVLVLLDVFLDFNINCLLLILM